MSERTIPFQVSWLMARVHIGTPYDEVAADMVRRMDDNEWPAGRERARTVTDALIQHRRNRADYAWVMGPH